jgi:eukaryotic-like serine/threonine-protein kinase
VPDLVSGYNIIRKLGEGARSIVYQVVEPASGKTYSLKRVTRESHEDNRYLDQAILGYEVANRLNHAYLQRAFSLKKIRRFFRLVEVHVLMEYVDGISLDKAPPERIDETVDLFLKVAEGLEAMHEANYLHTDIKPNNLLIPLTGGVKIIDFGQSCAIGFRKARIQGTPDYIAPEQVQRRHLTKQTDVFNLGATLYWALSGQTYPTIITKRGRRRDPLAAVKKPVPAPQDLNPEIPSILSRLVMECCADEPGRRPRDMKEVIGRLEMVRHVLGKRKQAGHDMAAAARPGASEGGPAASDQPGGHHQAVEPPGKPPGGTTPGIGGAT